MMEWTLLEWITQTLGLIGCLMVSIPFLLGSSLGHPAWEQTTWRFIIINFVGAILLLISLFFNFNLGSFMIEIFWITGGIIAIRKKLKAEGKTFFS